MARQPTHAGKKDVPHTFAEATKAGHPLAKDFNLWAKLADASRQLGTHAAAQSSQPGDKAWEGPCENHNKIVCYFDQDMQPTNCVNVRC